MKILENPVRERHWAITKLPAFLAGKREYIYFTPINIACRIVEKASQCVLCEDVKGSKLFSHNPGGIGIDFDSRKIVEKLFYHTAKNPHFKNGSAYQVFITEIWARYFTAKKEPDYQSQLVFLIWRKENKPLRKQYSMWGAL
jgi:hypothetical protein